MNRTKVQLKSVYDVVKRLGGTDGRVYLIDNSEEAAKCAYEYLSKNKIKHIFLYEKESGYDRVGVVLFEKNDYFKKTFCKDGGIDSDDAALYADEDCFVYVNPPANTMNEQLSRTSKGELIFHFDKDGKLLHSVYPH